MQWFGAAVQFSQFMGFIGIILGAYVYLKTRNPWTVVATLSCAVGFMAPFFGTDVPFRSVLYPYSYHGVVISLLLTVGPWFYLLPLTVDAPSKKRRKGKGKR